MFSLDTTTYVAFSNKLSNFSLHSSPPEPLTEILIHLSATRVNGKRRFMSFPENCLSQFPFLWHNQTVTKVDNTISIDRETLSTTANKVLFDLTDTDI